MLVGYAASYIAVMLVPADTARNIFMFVIGAFITWIVCSFSNSLELLLLPRISAAVVLCNLS